MLLLLVVLLPPKSYPLKESFYLDNFRLFYKNGYMIAFNLVDNQKEFISLDIYIDGIRKAHYGYLTEVHLHLDSYCDNIEHSFIIRENTSTTPNETTFKVCFPSGDFYLDKYEYSIGDFVKEYDNLVIRKKEIQYLKFDNLEYENKQNDFAYLNLKVLGKIKYDNNFDLGNISLTLINDGIFSYLEPYYLNFNLKVQNNYLVLNDSYALNYFSNQIYKADEKIIDKIYLPKKMNTNLIELIINIDNFYNTDINLHIKTYINISNSFDDLYKIKTNSYEKTDYDYKYYL
jgi:hypothetical protein